MFNQSRPVTRDGERPGTAQSSNCSSGLDSARSTPQSARRPLSIPAKLPPMEIMPASPRAEEEPFPATPNHVRFMQAMRRSIPQAPGVRASWPPSGPGLRGPGTSGAGWGAPANLSPLTPSAPATSPEKRRPQRRQGSRTRSSLDSVAMEAPAPAPAPKVLEEVQARPGSAKNRSQSEAPASHASPALKQQAVSALQKFFFEELKKDNDASGAAARALLRLNELAAADKEVESVPVPEPVPSPKADFKALLGSPPRPPTPLVGGPRGRRAIRVSNCGV
eukprot:gnl/MRDRNA2_/MRDRNA2_104940_c0_seq1.p1 gnl/MRDRNA2_/MRDRNA2_104940_c0~~gnl/MRDRNA2_/MRDRNA2_104940_c0_seq1.p1  ORF type:complete len:311 (+),score=64.55 gnl/MRDRNA2_/MRDRNA2_104940_c0_seq1:100-933(+)